VGLIANDAALQTVPRTINTGLGALFILLALYFLGGETLTDFALALIVGILVGTYSSVFTAAPLVVALERFKPTEAQARLDARQKAPAKPKPAGESVTPLASAATAKTKPSPTPSRPRAGSKRRRRRKR
jgi:SecD/SecF fusion protein